MNREKLHEAIGELLDNLSINNNRLSLHEERISQLDIDVLRKQCIDLYDTVNKLAISGKNTTSQTPQVPAVEKPAAAPAVEPDPIPETPVQIEEPIAETASEPKELKAPNQKKKSKPLDNSIHTKLQNEDEMVSLFEKFNSKPIETLAEGISISKRFEFQNNFFDGDAKEYKAFLELLESAADREGAFEIYHEYKNRLNWTQEELKDELKSLLYRKYLT